mmetsp:Transcript_2042/g.7905  ORF Transcript_2042/g.7905 Transcript_2042/m.7905 type:complete len:308 (+) Transcript_2042:417-1340(+)
MASMSSPDPWPCPEKSSGEFSFVSPDPPAASLVTVFRARFTPTFHAPFSLTAPTPFRFRLVSGFILAPKEIVTVPCSSVTDGVDGDKFSDAYFPLGLYTSSSRVVTTTTVAPSVSESDPSVDCAPSSSTALSWNHRARHCCAVRPLSILLMLLHRGPRLSCRRINVSSSPTAHASFFTLGSKCRRHRPMHCWSVRPSKCRAISAQRWPWARYRCASCASSSGVHFSFLMDGLTLCRHRCAHCWPVFPGSSAATRAQRLPQISCNRASSASSSTLHTDEFLPSFVVSLAISRHRKRERARDRRVRRRG